MPHGDHKSAVDARPFATERDPRLPKWLLVSVDCGMHLPRKHRRALMGKDVRKRKLGIVPAFAKESAS